MSADGCIETLRDPLHAVVGIMWHPESEPTPHPEELALLRSLFDP